MGTGALLTASREGIVNDISTFYFDDKATRGEVAEYVVKALKLEVYETEKIFKDTNNKYVNTLYAEGIVQGVIRNNERYYYEDNTITRGEIGSIILRVIEYQNNKNSEEEAISTLGFTEISKEK